MAHLLVPPDTPVDFTGEARILDDRGTEVATFTCTFRVARGQGYDD